MQRLYHMPTNKKSRCPQKQQSRNRSTTKTWSIMPYGRHNLCHSLQKMRSDICRTQWRPHEQTVFRTQTWHQKETIQSELATHCHGTHDPVKDLELFIIDHGIKDLRARERLEDYYICKLQTMAPHGMNTKINSYAKEMYASWSAVLKNDVNESQPTSQEWTQYLTSNIYTMLSICPLYMLNPLCL